MAPANEQDLELRPVFTSRGPEGTRRAAAELGRLLGAGDVIGLIGDLGAGKTCFAQGLARGLDVPEDAYVCSPTFALINVHEGRVPFHHVDLYRLEEPDEAVFVGYEDLYDSCGVVAVEWLDRFPELWPAGWLEVRLSEQGAERRVDGRGHGARAGALLDRWQRALRLFPLDRAGFVPLR